MKKILFCLLAASILVLSPISLVAQRSEPVYFINLFAGPNICEFAVDGPRRELIREVEPFVQNGRLYFACAALPISNGNLRSGFEFNLDWEQDALRIKALYQGQPRGSLPPEVAIEVNVAGYAERGSIIITHVFFTKEEESFINSVRSAF